MNLVVSAIFVAPMETNGTTLYFVEVTMDATTKLVVHLNPQLCRQRGVLLYLNLTMQSTNEYLNITLTMNKLPADLYTVKVRRQMNHPVIQAMIYC